MPSPAPVSRASSEGHSRRGDPGRRRVARRTTATPRVPGAGREHGGHDRRACPHGCCWPAHRHRTTSGCPPTRHGALSRRESRGVDPGPDDRVRHRTRTCVAMSPAARTGRRPQVDPTRDSFSGAVAGTMAPLVAAGRSATGTAVNEKRATRHRVALSHEEVRRCPTLPQGPPCSTIGAESLSFRVRNVTGRFPLAMAAETLLTCCRSSRSPTRQRSLRQAAGSRPYVENHSVDASICPIQTECYQDIGLLVPVSSVGL